MRGLDGQCRITKFTVTCVYIHDDLSSGEVAFQTLLHLTLVEEFRSQFQVHALIVTLNLDELDHWFDDGNMFGAEGAGIV